MSNITAINQYVCGFDEVEPQTNAYEYIQELKKVKEEIGYLTAIKDKLTKNILKELDLAIYDDSDTNIIAVAKDGQQSMDIGRFHVVFKTLSSPSVDAKQYELIKDSLPPYMNPIKTDIKYSIKKSHYLKILDAASQDDKIFLSTFIKDKYASPSITIEPRKAGA